MISVLLLTLIPLEYVGTAATSKFASLNATLGDRLGRTHPISEPCYDDSTSDACKYVQENYVNSTFRRDVYGAMMYPVWETCFATDQGCVLNYQDPTDPTPWTTQKCEIGSLSSAYLAVESAADVQAAFAFANSTGTLLSIKNTGHDFVGRSVLKNSLALWTHKLNNISYNAVFVPEGGQADVNYTAITLGAGAQWFDVYKFADEHNVTVVGGYHPTVGASGGYLMGAGYSVLTPTLGLGVDRVLQFKIVTPDGVYRTANEYQNADLFWALRGGGGGTFGVVLESTILATPQLTLQVVSVSFNRTEETARNFLKLVIDNGVEWSNAGWGGHIYQNSFISVNPLLTHEEALESMQNASDYVLALNGSVVIEELPSFFAFFEKYVPTAEAVVGVHPVLGTRLISTSIFSNESAKAQLLEAFSAMIPFATVDPQINAVTPFLYKHMENATSVLPAWRDALWQVVFAAEVSWNATEAEKQEVFSLVNEITQPLRDVSPDSGAYMNEAFIYEPDFDTAFWGDNYPRLLALKHKYDPNGLLDCWHCVGWQGAQDERYSCYPDFAS
ncbi:FAD-binding domain-containing protein [Mycena sanguinolenta]|uniref:FAD-binding domain-containing protein n=1 Tax=Mycena sanguinolenta TaxID=230812 RepID=A0A8H6Z0A7_9AGAR|nr:FAD-binding domain-containing protein [Mycena sanguinolenta]